MANEPYWAFRRLENSCQYVGNTEGTDESRPVLHHQDCGHAEGASRIEHFFDRNSRFGRDSSTASERARWRVVIRCRILPRRRKIVPRTYNLVDFGSCRAPLGDIRIETAKNAAKFLRLFSGEGLTFCEFIKLICDVLA